MSLNPLKPTHPNVYSFVHNLLLPGQNSTVVGPCVFFYELDFDDEYWSSYQVWASMV